MLAPDREIAGYLAPCPQGAILVPRRLLGLWTDGFFSHWMQQGPLLLFLLRPSPLSHPRCRLLPPRGDHFWRQIHQLRYRCCDVPPSHLPGRFPIRSLWLRFQRRRLVHRLFPCVQLDHLSCRRHPFLRRRRPQLQAHLQCRHP